MMVVAFDTTYVVSPSFVFSSTHWYSFASVHPAADHAFPSQFPSGKRFVVASVNFSMSRMTSQTPDTVSGWSSGVNQQMDWLPDRVVAAGVVPAVVLAAKFVVHSLPVVEVSRKN